MEEKKVKKLLPLVKQSNMSFKIVVPKEVERKIRLLCREIHNIEWSGVLFYKVEGSFEDKSLVVKCVDIYQMDIGNGAYTEYTVSPDVATYMMEHELFDCYQGHIHSHHNMSTFFSGTDTQELLDGGMDSNHFVSLIVNNAGKYTAGITRKVKSIKSINESYTYPTWNDEEKSGSMEYQTESEYMQWFNLEVEIQDKVNPFEIEMLERIKELKDIKSKRTYKGNNATGSFVPVGKYSPSPSLSSYNAPVYGTAVPAWSKPKETPKQAELPFKKEEEEEIIDIPYGIVTFDEELLNSVLKQLITLSIIIPHESNIDLNKWVNSMEKLYDKRFNSMVEFEAFATNYIDFLINYTEDPVLLERIGVTEMSAILAYDLTIKLEAMPRNKYIKCFIGLLDDYILA